MADPPPKKERRKRKWDDVGDLPQAQPSVKENAKVFIDGMENAPSSFGLRDRLQGPHAQYIKHIAVTAGSACEVVLKGVGSGHLDASGGQDASMRLHFDITANSAEAVSTAQQLCEDLLGTAKQQYKEYMQSLSTYASPSAPAVVPHHGYPTAPYPGYAPPAPASYPGYAGYGAYPAYPAVGTPVPPPVGTPVPPPVGTPVPPPVGAPVLPPVGTSVPPPAATPAADNVTDPSSPGAPVPSGAGPALEAAPKSTSTRFSENPPPSLGASNMAASARGTDADLMPPPAPKKSDGFAMPPPAPLKKGVRFSEEASGVTLPVLPDPTPDTEPTRPGVKVKLSEDIGFRQARSHDEYEHTYRELMEQLGF
uniref:KHDC4/BBP-like KH-domain type I domain-containing protein n=1 Tax=Eutreptiella gymnastica TaxID=73025 RepID=A0A7S4CIB8_9EUGL